MHFIVHSEVARANRQAVICVFFRDVYADLPESLTDTCYYK